MLFQAVVLIELPDVDEPLSVFPKLFKLFRLEVMVADGAGAF